MSKGRSSSSQSLFDNIVTELPNQLSVRVVLARSPGCPSRLEPARSQGFVTAWAVREERGQIYPAPEVLEITNRYNENYGVSKRVHELAFGIVICFGISDPCRLLSQ